ncbi:Phospholipase DDHD1 [Bagarius yarrelli]|uniref:Phospholipase DDHD1 n=1 Tax=Bagarius yarrelli TaxID=175774 RepID=A0A556VXE5_BAGYA|nr:Phospholipase DDHD1 [Bagarius yarrelli]
MSDFSGAPQSHFRASDWAVSDARVDMMDTHRDMMDTHGMLLGLSEDATYSDPDYLNPNYADGDEPAARTRPSTRSRSGEVTELEAQEVRWFYREDKRNWKPFVGHDSLKIELAYRTLCAQRDARAGVFEPEDSVCECDCVCEGVEAVCVRGGLYEVDVREKECYPVYWNPSSSGTRLHRGYVEEAALEDTPPAATHIVFVVHGIGQKMDQGRIIRNTSMMRDAARKMAEKHFSDRTTEHVEFLPVEWRSKLALDGDTVDTITPDKVRGLRDMLNSSAMDIMYYTSPLYRDEITRGLTFELNRLYTLFCSRNPEFEDQGQVSIVAHSLGCVITYDIITGWDPVRIHHQEAAVTVETEPLCRSGREQRLVEELQLTRMRLRDLQDQFQSLKSSRNFPALKFKVENFFCMGSPLAVFLALRGVRPGSCRSQDHILSRSICSRLFNIFHPTDPVAYRLEPLILKHYSNIAPVQIHCGQVGGAEEEPINSEAGPYETEGGANGEEGVVTEATEKMEEKTERDNSMSQSSSSVMDSSTLPEGGAGGEPLLVGGDVTHRLLVLVRRGSVSADVHVRRENNKQRRGRNR